MPYKTLLQSFCGQGHRSRTLCQKHGQPRRQQRPLRHEQRHKAQAQAPKEELYIRGPVQGGPAAPARTQAQLKNEATTSTRRRKLAAKKTGFAALMAKQPNPLLGWPRRQGGGRLRCCRLEMSKRSSFGRRRGATSERAAPAARCLERAALIASDAEKARLAGVRAHLGHGGRAVARRRGRAGSRRARRGRG